MTTPVKPVIVRRIREADERKSLSKLCPVCGSSIKRRWFKKRIECLNPLCVNYSIVNESIWTNFHLLQMNAMYHSRLLWSSLRITILKLTRN